MKAILLTRVSTDVQDPVAQVNDLETYAREKGYEFGKTAAKCHFSIFQCFILLGKNMDAEIELEKLRSYNQNTYLLVEGRKVSFEALAKEILIKSNTI
jgi:DNA invertase Pin-like site-specific DNA recombinase